MDDLDASVMIDFRRLTVDDFPMLARWLARDQVARWWNHDFSAEAVARDFGPAARGEEPSEDFVALLGTTPIGLMKRYRYDDYPEYRVELAPYVDVPPDAVSIDYLIGEGDHAGKGLGSRMIKAMVDRTWVDHPRAPAIIVPVAAGNVASWRALEKAGLTRIAEGDLKPDNPVDPPLHYIYRVERP